MKGDAVLDGRKARGARARTLIVDAALELFAENGYSATSIGMLAKRAGVGGQSIYHAFGSKEGVLAAAMEEAAEQFFADLAPAASAPSPEDAIRRIADIVARRPQYLRLHLVLILERRGGDAAILERARALRQHGRELAYRQIDDILGAHLPDGVRERAIEDASRLLLILIDGAFIERELSDDDVQLHRLFELVGTAIGAVLGRAVELHAEQPPAHDGARQ